jgi:kynureninase
LTPDHTGWFSHADPFEFDIRHFEAHPSALRFWGGTPSIAPYVMASAAISDLCDFGIDKLRDHNLHLMQGFINRYEHELCAHYKSLTHVKQSNDNDPTRHSATLCLKHSPENFARFSARLKREAIIFDARKNTFRISFGMGNNEGDALLLSDLFKR